MAAPECKAAHGCWLVLVLAATSAQAAPSPRPSNPNAVAATPAQDPNISAEDAAILQDFAFFELFDLLRDLHLFTESP